MSTLKRRGPLLSQDGADGPSAVGAADLSRWPALLEFVSAESWPDGGQRETGTLLLFCEAGRLKGCLSDRDQGLVGFVTGASVLDVLDTCQAQLAADTVDWRRARARTKR